MLRDLVAGQIGTLTQPTQLGGEPASTDGRTGGYRHLSTLPGTYSMSVPCILHP